MCASASVLSSYTLATLSDASWLLLLLVCFALSVVLARSRETLLPMRQDGKALCQVCCVGAGGAEGTQVRCIFRDALCGIFSVACW